MSATGAATPLDDYLAGLDAPAREAFEHIRGLAAVVVPDAEQGRSYGMAALKHRGKPLLGFLAAKSHLSVFPFSPAVVDTLAPRLPGYELSKGTIRFHAERPPPDDVMLDAVRQRVAEIESG